MFASLFLVGGAGRRCVAILNDNGAIWTPWLVLVGARPARHTGGVIVRVRSVSDWARLAFHGARVGSLSRGTLRGIGGMQQVCVGAGDHARKKKCVHETTHFLPG